MNNFVEVVLYKCPIYFYFIDASYLSQVARDQSVKDWKFMEAIDVDSYGSGYPAGRWIIMRVITKL